MVVSSIVLPLILAVWPPPPVAVSPVVDLPADLELCIHKAEICVLELERDVCGEVTPEDRNPCLADYEDCSFDISEAHEASCRIEYVWYKLEAYSPVYPPEWMDYIGDVYATCPTL